VGKKNQPAFKIVVTDKRNPARAGRFVEEVGFYNPLTKEKLFQKERIQYWLAQGAKNSSTAHNLFLKEGIIQGKKILVHKKSKKPAEKEPTPVDAPPAAEAVSKQEVSAPPPKQETAVPEKDEEKK